PQLVGSTDDDGRVPRDPLQGNAGADIAVLDGAVFLKPGDLRRAVPRLRQDRVVVLADMRGRSVDGAAAMGEFESRADEGQVAVGRGDMLDHVAMGELGVVDDLRDRPDPGAGYVERGQALLPILGAVAGERVLDDPAQRG